MLSSLPFPSIHWTFWLSLHPKSGSLLMMFTAWPFISLISSSPSSPLTRTFCFCVYTTPDMPTSNNDTVSEVTSTIYYSPTCFPLKYYSTLVRPPSLHFFLDFFFRNLVFIASELSCKILLQDNPSFVCPIFRFLSFGIVIRQKSSRSWTWSPPLHPVQKHCVAI